MHTHNVLQMQYYILHLRVECNLMLSVLFFLWNSLWSYTTNQQVDKQIYYQPAIGYLQYQSVLLKNYNYLKTMSQHRLHVYLSYPNSPLLSLAHCFKGTGRWLLLMPWSTGNVSSKSSKSTSQRKKYQPTALKLQCLQILTFETSNRR